MTHNHVCAPVPCPLAPRVQVSHGNTPKQMTCRGGEAKAAHRVGRHGHSCRPCRPCPRRRPCPVRRRGQLGLQRPVRHLYPACRLCQGGHQRLQIDTRTIDDAEIQSNSHQLLREQKGVPARVTMKTGLAVKSVFAILARFARLQTRGQVRSPPRGQAGKRRCHPKQL